MSWPWTVRETTTGGWGREEDCDHPTALHQVEIKSDYLENQSYWNNLHFDWIIEDPLEDWSTMEWRVIRHITNNLGLPAPYLERAHQWWWRKSKGGLPDARMVPEQCSNLQNNLSLLWHILYFLQVSQSGSSFLYSFATEVHFWLGTDDGSSTLFSYQMTQMDCASGIYLRVTWA